MPGFAAAWASAKLKAEHDDFLLKYDSERLLPPLYPREVRNAPPFCDGSGNTDGGLMAANLGRRFAYARVSPPTVFSRSVTFFAFARKAGLPPFNHPDTPWQFDDNGDGLYEDVYTLFSAVGGGVATTLLSSKLGQISRFDYPHWPPIMPMPDDTYIHTICYRGYEVTHGKAIVDYSGGFTFID